MQCIIIRDIKRYLACTESLVIEGGAGFALPEIVMEKIRGLNYREDQSYNNIYL